MALRMDMKIKNSLVILMIIVLQTSLMNAQMNWAENVAPILFDHCTKCHHPGGIGPSSFMTYDEAAGNSASILGAIMDGYMPPWPANPNYRHFLNENVLTDTEKSTIENWVMNGTPSGNLSLAPTPPVYNNQTQLQQVDFTGTTPLNTSQAVTHDYYRTFVVPSNYSVDQFIDGIEIIPGNSEIVHHVVIYYDPTNECLSLDAADTEPGFLTNGTGGGLPAAAHYIGAWVPGKGPQNLPQGFGIRAEANGYYLIEMHYPAGSVGQQDETTLNIKHSSSSSPREVWYNPVITHDPYTLDEAALIIPANVERTFHATYNVPINISLIGISPHMHLIGKSIKSFCVNGNDSIPLIDIPNWDFDWQLGYDYPQLVRLPAQSQLKAVATYDNTINNPNQPVNPPQLVTAGEETTDEMMVIFYLYSYWMPGDEDIVINPNTSVSNTQPTPQLWQFFPNPTQDKIQWSCIGPQYRKAHFSILDMNGSVCKKEQQMISGGMESGSIDLTDLSPGVYFIQVKSNDYTHTEKLIIE